MESLYVNGNRYEFATNYKENKQLRDSFNNLTRKTYGFDFKKWYEDGYWKDNYIPYSLVYESKVISNVSVNIMDFIILGEKKRYIQIGTVMTDRKYQGNGLSRVLMQKVLDEWEEKCDFLYLFANKEVLNFYPKFGFTSENEYQYSIDIREKSYLNNKRKMDINKEEDIKLLCNIIPNSKDLWKISMINNTSLVMFYCTSFMKDSIYYIEELDAIAIADYDEDTIYLHEIFSIKNVKLHSVINNLATKDIKNVILGFTPNIVDNYEVSLLKDEDNTLFIKDGKGNPFKSNKLMFPILSHA